MNGTDRGFVWALTGAAVMFFGLVLGRCSAPAWAQNETWITQMPFTEMKQLTPPGSLVGPLACQAPDYIGKHFRFVAHGDLWLTFVGAGRFVVVAPHADVAWAGAYDRDGKLEGDTVIQGWEAINPCKLLLGGDGIGGLLT